ncbi:MAG: hypothetical protein AB7E52_03260 [Bdellovibrionales bacterium]
MITLALNLNGVTPTADITAKLILLGAFVGMPVIRYVKTRDYSFFKRIAQKIGRLFSFFS